MLNEKEKNKNSNKTEPNEAVKLSCGLGAFFISQQTQEELTQRTLFYETGNNNYLPDPNEREQFRNRGVYWIPQRHNTKHKNAELKPPL
jgi:thioredoxin reductase